ncbi:MAG: hypothetical protein KJI72_01330 [Patescibacteria group bacterium]|nr:hypothetical protein [Patescibacteria group bacterium]
MGNEQEEQLAVYEKLLDFGTLVPRELWKHRDEVVEVAERALGMSPVVDKHIAELKMATQQHEFYPPFRRLLDVLKQPAATVSS